MGADFLDHVYVGLNSQINLNSNLFFAGQIEGEVAGIPMRDGEVNFLHSLILTNIKTGTVAEAIKLKLADQAACFKASLRNSRAMIILS